MAKNAAIQAKKIFCTLLAFMIALPAMFSFPAYAADQNGYYKTVASVHYENADPAAEKTDGVFITTLNNGSTGYLHGNPAQTHQYMEISSIPGLKSGETYTYSIDLYVLEYSNDSNGTLAAFFLQNDAGYQFQNWVGKSQYHTDQWFTFQRAFTSGSDQVCRAKIYTYGDANILYDNLRIVDQSGKTVFFEDFETEKYDLPAGFSYVHDYTGGCDDGQNIALHLTNTDTAFTTANTQAGTIGGDPLGTSGVQTTYTVSFDYMILRKASSTVTSHDFAFGVGHYCAECRGGEDHAPVGTALWFYGDILTTNVWYTASETLTLKTQCQNIYMRFSLYAGAELLVDNIKITDAAGAVVVEYDMNTGSVKGNMESSFAGEVDFLTLNELLWCKGTPNVEDTHLYFNATKLKTDYQTVDIAFDMAAAIEATEYPYLNFRYRLLGSTTLASGAMMAISLNGNATYPAIQTINIPANYTAGEWISVTDLHFHGEALPAGSGNFLRLSVYKGVAIEIDQIEIHKNENYGGAVLANINFTDNGTFEEVNAELPEEADDTAMLIDTTSVADDGNSNKNFWFNELGMASYYHTLTQGASYSIVFDVYPLQKSTGKVDFFHYRTSAGSGSSNAGWWGKDLVVGRWQTTSNTFTVTNTHGNHILYVYGGFKGYIDNVRLVDAYGNEVAGTFTNFDDLSVPGKYADYLTLTTDIPEKVIPDTALLADLTSVADDGNSNKSFWFNELGMANYKNQLTEGAQYTITFDVYPLQKSTVKVDFFHYRTGSGSGASSDAGWWGRDLEIGKWQTTSYTFTINNTYGNHILFIYGGFKGYIDNVRLVDSDGNDVYSTYTDFSGLSIPEKYADYLTLTTDIPAVSSEDLRYSVRRISDGMGMIYYGSNGVLKIAPLSDLLYPLNDQTVGVNFTEGTQYRLTFDYRIEKPSQGTNVMTVCSVLDGGGDDSIGNPAACPEIGAKEYVFTASGEAVGFRVYAGSEVIIDNIVIEQFVPMTSSESSLAELKAKPYTEGASTYIDVTVNTSVSAKSFSFHIGYSANILEYSSGRGQNTSVTVGQGQNNLLSVTASSTSKTWYGSQKAVTGDIAILTFRVLGDQEAIASFTIPDFNNTAVAIPPAEIAVNTHVISLGACKRESASAPGEMAAVSFGMQLAVGTNGQERIEGQNVLEKGFLVAIGYHLDGELQLETTNPYVVKRPVSAPESEGSGYRVYTLAVTDPEGEYAVAARPYAMTENGSVFYGKAISATAGAFGNSAFDVRVPEETVTASANLAIGSAAKQTWQGANAISQGFIFTNGYTDQQIETELARIDEMDIQMVRSYYDQTFSAYYQAATKTIGYNWNTTEMQGLVKWLKAMEARNVEVALNMSWGVGDIYDNHCTTYSYDDCDAENGHNTVENANNPFWCIRREVGKAAAIAAYGDWVAESMKYLLEDCGLTNLHYLIMFTEPTRSSELPDRWMEYQTLVKAAHEALVNAGLRGRLKMVGPNIGLSPNSYAAKVGETGATYIDDIEDILPLITDYIDIYSFHFYAPNWPDGGAVPKNAADNNYELYAKHFNTFISEINKYDSGADYWLDEWNYSGMFIKTPYYATQLAQAVAAALNTGTQNVMLWQLFETKWPERQDTGGEFAGGIHKIGLAPPLTESQVPYDSYYGYSLLTKYMGKRNATVYHGTGDQGVYTAMIENTDGTQSILVVNTNQSAKMIHLTTGRKVNGVLLRHLYDPATVAPSARAAVISADKAFNDVSAGLTDVIPAGAVVVYTTEP